MKLYSEGKKEFDHITQRIGDLDRQRLALKSTDSLRDLKEVINSWDTLDEEVKREFISVCNIKVLVGKETAEVIFLDA